jgi:hypothetical protein
VPRPRAQQREEKLVTSPKNAKGRNPRQGATQKTSTVNRKGTSAEAQRARILKWLRKMPLDTVDAYVLLGSLHAPRRVMELRRAGYAIGMRWIWRYGPEGEPHRVGQYFLAEAAR